MSNTRDRKEIGVTNIQARRNMAGPTFELGRIFFNL